MTIENAPLFIFLTCDGNEFHNLVVWTVTEEEQQLEKCEGICNRSRTLDRLEKLGRRKIQDA